ncbi:ribosomal L28 family-domain-containing protein [Hypomontagnella submonticulosa]|nr:ribosomal L28 family-domain-containing protein [Hypomontagnella submonticulosa]
MPPIRLPTGPSRCLLSSTSSPLTATHTPASLQRIPATRALSTTPASQRQKPSHLTVPKDQVPEYPYGRFRTYKQANEGLFAGSKIRFGNVVAEKYGNKSRTTWLPNRHTKRLWSPSLGAFVRTRMTARVLRTIDRLGGIDEYLLGSKAQRVKDLGPAGWALRWKIMQTPAVQERFARERAALGLPPKEVGEIALPQDLLVDGYVTAEAVMSEVDGMLERGDEFVIGEVKEGEDMIVKGDAEAIEEAREAAKDMDSFMEEKSRADVKTPGP